MRLYHASPLVIEHPDIYHSRNFLDFGKGFYLSDNEQQAFEMASYKASQFDSEPVVNVFEFDERILTDSTSTLNIKRFDSYSKEWAEFVFANRSNENSLSPVHDYDIVYGPIANDRVGLQIRNYMEHNIDLETFLERLKFIRGITFQYFFGTQRAVNLLTKL